MTDPRAEDEEARTQTFTLNGPYDVTLLRRYVVQRPRPGPAPTSSVLRHPSRSDLPYAGFEMGLENKSLLIPPPN
ncbi:unnamed protein product [Lota lota]